MASKEHRKFYYDWNEGRYKLSDENIYNAKEMDWNCYGRGYGIDKEKESYEENNNMMPLLADDALLQNKNENNIAKGFDKVDSGRGKMDKANKNKSTESQILNEDMNSFIEYILRLNDDAVVVDILPILTKRVKDDGPELSTLSMGACLDLLPVLGKLLDSKYEDYVIAAVDMIREIMKRWWRELQTIGKKEKHDFGSDFRCSRSVNGVYMILISMTDRIRVLAKRTGKIGEKAKVLQELLALI